MWEYYMVDIQSPTAEIRLGKKKEETTGQIIMSASAIRRAAITILFYTT